VNKNHWLRKERISDMKTHWFSILSVAGIVLLAGNTFGNELRWKKPAASEPAVPSITHIPAVISLDDLFEPSTIVQVQQTSPIPPPAAPHDLRLPELSLPGNNPLPGATIQNAPLAPPPVAPIRNVPPTPLPQTQVQPQQTQPRGLVTSCDDQIVLKSIRDISHDIRPMTASELPDECAIDSAPYLGRHFRQSCFMWKASALSTRAAYF
jgi:hypothetical protein